MRKKMMAAAWLMAAVQVNAQEDTLRLQEVVITGTKFEIPVEKSGKTIYKLSREDIEKNAGKSVSDLLNALPGMEVNGAYGTPGTNISYSLRGARNNSVLVLIDGVPLNDPSAIDTFYDLRFLPLEQIESIEVLNGGLSTLYGTGASAGVINIRLRKPSDEIFDGTFDVNGGSYGTFNQNLHLGGTSDRISYMLSTNHAKSEGFSAAIERDTSDGFDKDGFERKNMLARLGYRFNDKFKLELLSAYDKFNAEYDKAAFIDADNEQWRDELRFGIKPTFIYSKGHILLNAIYNINKNDFRDSYPVAYKGKNLQADLINEHQFNDAMKGLFGVNFQSATYEQLDVAEFDANEFLIVDPYASLLYESNFGLNLHLGTRLNNHSEYGTHLIYNVNPSYIFDVTGAVQLKLKGSVSTAFVTPSLYQLYSFYGNVDLKPEESTNYDAGISLYIRDRLSVNATYYIRDEAEVIGFVSSVDDQGNFTGTYRNLQEEREIKGVELLVDWEIADVVDFNAYFSQIDKDNSTPFYRLPENKWGFGIGWQPADNSNVSLKYKRTGERTDIDFMTGDVVLDSYTVVDVYADYLFFDKLKVYGAINNIFDTQFVNTWGFNTRGRNFNVGVSYQW